ncbi:MAG TPA: hypothetical protein PLV92_01610 [Pirellulaceae bacterium]|nr:hypothetical protein [Pirellulaceae bacterium]
MRGPSTRGRSILRRSILWRAILGRLPVCALDLLLAVHLPLALVSLLVPA